ncbi:male sterility protein-domain-containing protein [Penicillium frequentans]|nr:male sterility protein-domain-containing protein [Penicillium glabrum]
MAISTDSVDWKPWGCLLYKLAVQLPTAKIFVLCRGSVRKAMEKWEASMPEQIDDIFDTGKVHCLIGDITQPIFGLEKKEIEALQQEVTVVIHAAASLSLFQDLLGTIQINCLPVISLARMLLSFQNIKAFLHVSSISALSFLSQDSLFEKLENISSDEDSPEKQLVDILATGQSPYTELFMSPYAQAKYLAEKLVLNLQTPFPVLIIRPSSIGPAIQIPYPLYGPDGAIPIHTFAHLLIEGGIDVVSNACLLHLSVGSTGIVHVGSQLYATLTVGGYISQLQRHLSKDLSNKVNRLRLAKKVDFVDQADEMLGRISREWKIDCERSKALKATNGPIGLPLAGRDFDDFVDRRIQQQIRHFDAWADTLMPA